MPLELQPVVFTRLEAFEPQSSSLSISFLDPLVDTSPTTVYGRILDLWIFGPVGVCYRHRAESLIIYLKYEGTGNSSSWPWSLMKKT